MRFEIISVVSRWPKGLSCDAGMPDRNFFCFPGFRRPDADRVRRNVRHHAAAAGPRVLNDRHRVQFDQPRAQSAIFGRRGGRVLIRAAPPGRIVEGPMLHLALAALHDHAARRDRSYRCNRSDAMPGK